MASLLYKILKSFLNVGSTHFMFNFQYELLHTCKKRFSNLCAYSVELHLKVSRSLAYKT